MHTTPWNTARRIADWALRLRVMPGRRRASFWDVAL